MTTSQAMPAAAPTRPGTERVSVAMCTYNGAAHVEAQVASILAQARPVDEIVVSDDGSSDDTLRRVRALLEAGAVPWRILPGQRLGITQNFARAVSACSGDIVFLSDQDDVWTPNKVGAMLDLLRQHPTCALAFSNARLVDAGLRDLGRSQFDIVRLSPALRRALAGPRAFETLLRRNVVTGATVAFRRRLLEDALPFVDGWLHDEWLAIVAAARGPLLAHPEPLVLYRQHGRNQCGMSAEPVSRQVAVALKARRNIVEPQRLQALAERLQGKAALAPPQRMAWLNQAQAFHAERAMLPPGRVRRAIGVLRLAGSLGYGKYGAGWRAAAKDLLNTA